MHAGQLHLFELLHEPIGFELFARGFAQKHPKRSLATQTIDSHTVDEVHGRLALKGLKYSEIGTKSGVGH